MSRGNARERALSSSLSRPIIPLLELCAFADVTLPRESQWLGIFPLHDISEIIREYF